MDPTQSPLQELPQQGIVQSQNLLTAQPTPSQPTPSQPTPSQLTPLYDPANGPMRVVGFMSGSGSNIRQLLQVERALYSPPSNSHASSAPPPYRIVGIFTDETESNARLIARDFNIPVIIRDIGAWYGTRGKPRKIGAKEWESVEEAIKVREEYDAETVKLLNPFDAQAFVFGGYMSLASSVLFNAAITINVHPADLAVMKKGRRAYTGDRAMEKAIRSGASNVRATTHIVNEKPDQGPILMVSAPMNVDYGEGVERTDIGKTDKKIVERVAKSNQNRLKEVGDLVIFPRTLLAIANGRYMKNEKGGLYFDRRELPIPHGIDVRGFAHTLSELIVESL